MMKFYVIIFLLVTIPFISFSQDRASDSLALVAIYESLDGDNWPQNDNWLSDLPLEEWKGIGVTNNRVNKLEVKSTASASTSGTFPMQVLELTELTTLEFTWVVFNEPLPESLLQLTKLNRLVMKYNQLNGELPQIFDQFENLKTLVLTFNELTGPLPALPQDIDLVYVDRNQFDGPIPQSWEGNEMGALQLHGNNLTGNYDLISTMPNLNKINLSDNDWDEAPLPLWIDDINNLDRFSCDGCNITGEIPLELDFSNQEIYSGMFLSDNQLSGDISILFNNPEHGQKLYLRARNNNLSGELPVHKMTSFNQLDVYGNNYSSMTEPIEDASYTIDILYNDFTYESLVPVQEAIAVDSLIAVKYWQQNRAGTRDTLTITSAESLTLSSYDNHPSTTYQWYKNNQPIENETEPELILDITDNTSSGQYYCNMMNPNFSELNLKTEVTILDVDIVTSTDNISTEEIIVSPNPVINLMSIYGLGANSYPYQIKAIDGKIIRSGKTNKNQNIDLRSCAPGIYTISLYINNEITTRKFIKL